MPATPLLDRPTAPAPYPGLRPPRRNVAGQILTVVVVLALLFAALAVAFATDLARERDANPESAVISMLLE